LSFIEDPAQGELINQNEQLERRRRWETAIGWLPERTSRLTDRAP